jgi:hypothetical protein
MRWVDVTASASCAVIERAQCGAARASPVSNQDEQGRAALRAQPDPLEEISTAGTRERMGAVIGGFLPYILLMVCLMAAMYPAIDLGAGEKERGTLETLLLAPIPRTQLVLAKFLVLFTVGLTSALLMVASMGLVLFLFGNRFEGGLALMVRAIGAGDLAMVALMLVPTAAIFASILLSISIYAKSYKEAAGPDFAADDAGDRADRGGHAAGRGAELVLVHGPADQCLAGHEGAGQGHHGLPHVRRHPALDHLDGRRPAGLVPLVVQPRRSPVSQLIPPGSDPVWPFCRILLP